MDTICKSCVITAFRETAENIYDVTVCSKELSGLCKPGQFLHIQCGGDTLLRRPISICDVDNDCVRFIFEVRGEGTLQLSKYNIGDKLDILGPLGKGFTVGDTSKKAIFVGGGIGIYPLLMPAKLYGENAVVLLGFRNKCYDVLSEDFKKAGCKVLIATDDGSKGIKGFVTDFLGDEISNSAIDRIFACGPLPMIKKTALEAHKNNIYCEVSMEERMGCGIGACLVCACKAKENGEEHFVHVCKDGPVFDSRTVIFDE